MLGIQCRDNSRQPEWLTQSTNLDIVDTVNYIESLLCLHCHSVKLCTD